MSERYEYLQNLSEEEKQYDIILKPIKGDIPKLLEFYDITEDKDFWVNKGIARYFEIKSIRSEQ